MSTHNIGFYEDLTKIIFELSSNIIKYAPYFFCWVMLICSAWGVIQGFPCPSKLGDFARDFFKCPLNYLS